MLIGHFIFDLTKRVYGTIAGVQDQYCCPCPSTCCPSSVNILSCNNGGSTYMC